METQKEFTKPSFVKSLSPYNLSWEQYLEKNKGKFYLDEKLIYINGPYAECL